MNEKLFNDLPDHEIIQGYMYEGKNSIGLNEILARVGTPNENGEYDNEQLLTESLNYLRPLLEEGKLKSFIRDQKQDNSYTNHLGLTPDEAIVMIKKLWHEMESDDDKRHFEQFNVAFGLPENPFGCEKLPNTIMHHQPQK